MTGKQTQHLVKMANEIARNLGAGVDDARAVQGTREHLQKFWTPAMCEQLRRHAGQGGEHGLLPEVQAALQVQTQEQG